MSRLLMVLVVAAGLGGISESARAQLNTFSVGPFSHYWAFEARPLNGNVRSVETGREVEKKRRGGAAATGGGTAFQVFQTTEFRPLPGGGREAHLGQARRTDAVITYDAAGHVLKIEHDFVKGGSGQPVHAVETATCRDGHLKAIEMRANNDPPQTITFEEEPLADGGRKLSWAAPGAAADAPKAEMTYDGKGHLVSYSPSPQPSPRISPAMAAALRLNVTLEYNEHGDVVAVRQHAGNNVTAETFAYEYDAAGNWVRRQRFTEFAGKSEPREIDVRRIQYAAGAAKVAAAASRTGGAKATTRPVAGAAAVSPGTYRVVRGEKGSTFSSEMTLELKSDHTARYSIVSVLKDQRNEKSLEGTWQPDGEGITVAFSKTGDGKPAPASMRTMRFHGNGSGGLVSAVDPATTFEPVASESKQAAAPPKPAKGGDDGLD
jgi:hypothetical protein